MNNNDIQYQTIVSTQIYLNSANSDIFLNGAMKSNVAFFFRDIVTIDKSTLEMRVSVVDAQFPVSWYLINPTNNLFYNYGVANYFPEGNYNITSFINQWVTTYGSNWTLNFNQYNNKLTFINSTNAFAFSDNNSVFSLLPLLGFTEGGNNTYYSAYLNGVYTLTAPYSVNFSGLTKLNIKSNTFSLKNVDSNNKGRTRTICSVPINASSNGIIYYNNFTQYKSMFKNNELSSINIEIMDDYRNYVDFHNVDWTITLQIDLVVDYIENTDNLEDVYNNLRKELRNY